MHHGTRQSDLESDTRYGFLDNSTVAPLAFNPRLIFNSEGDNMLRAIRDQLRVAESFSFSIAFISSSALALLKQALVDFDGHGEIITSNYLDFNEPSMFQELLELDGVDVFVQEDAHAGFHPKGYVFRQPGEVTAIVGSSNLTDKALLRNTEWNIRFSTSHNGDIAFQIEDAISLQRDNAQRLSAKWIENYAARRRPPSYPATQDAASVAELPTPESGSALRSTIVANDMQREALSNLESLRNLGENKAVIISATGTGKTILAALAAKAFQPMRVLFVAHRGQILNKSRKDFEKVLLGEGKSFGLYVGNRKEIGADYLFASVQSLTRNDNLRNFAPDHFDFVIVDEVHRGSAATYRKVIDYFKPKFLLGVTATPERTDGQNIFELFDYNVPYEIRLQPALEAGMLSPFHYFGVTDFVTSDGETVEDTTELSRLTSDERTSHILEMLRVYGYPEGVHGLIFCSSKAEARGLSEKLNQSTFRGKLLRTEVLLGEHSLDQREASVSRLESGEIDYIVTVDVFNEGIDIPCVNQVVMLRSTESSIIFTQQLGRGLRKFPGKDHLRVIDFIGNYRNNFLIPIALYGDNSRSIDSLRKKMISNGEDNSLAGLSSVNFDEISKKRIYDALDTAQLDSIRQFKEDIQNLQARNNRIPQLLDFARFDTVDPLVIATRRTDHYWDLLNRAKFIDVMPSPLESKYLKFLSVELLPGKQPQELILLQHLLRHGSITRNDFLTLLSDLGVSNTEADISVLERVLDFSFYKRQAHPLAPIIETDATTLRLAPEFRDLYEASSDPFPFSFKSHVDDILDTAIYRSRELNYWSGKLQVGNTYSRKDVSRILHLKTNEMATLYGYKVDEYSGTVPIFVNYHKHDDIDSSIAYEDEFLDHSTMRWFTRSRKTLNSKNEADIIRHKYPLHVFVKRDDTSKEEFYYLGEATPHDPEQAYMKDKHGKSIGVVKMLLTLDTPLSDSFLHYLESGAE